MMPPRKRKAPAKAAAPANKRARVEESSVQVEQAEPISQRPKRKSVGTPQYNFTRTHKRTRNMADDVVEVEEIEATPTDIPKRRGRPPKADSSTTKDSKSASKKVSTTKPPVKDEDEAPVAKRRGRPPKSVVLRKAKSPPQKKSAPKSVTQTTQSTTEGTRPPRPRGRPRKSQPTQTVASLLDTLAEDMAGANSMTDEDPETDAQNDHQYWLMKAEPNDRYENGVNVKFSIDDLAAAPAPEPWDGVRNYAARNNMRAMRRGDLAFFYHSNCPVPGVVGVMRVVQEHSPDRSAFDPNHPYYDPKSVPSNPRWDCVHVEFVKKFENQVTLKMMQENRNGGGQLAGMQLLKMSRLSVCAVSPKEWRCVLDMAGEDVNVGTTDGIVGGGGGAVTDRDGYESDTDGEVDGGPREELNGDIAASATAAETE